jgi:hypothetical protein
MVNEGVRSSCTLGEPLARPVGLRHYRRPDSFRAMFSTSTALLAQFRDIR